MQFECTLPVIAGWFPSLYVSIELFKMTLECIIGKHTIMRVKRVGPSSKIKCKMKIRRLIGPAVSTVNDGAG